MINKDTFITGNVNETHKTHRKAAIYAILGDLLFIVLPLVVISIVAVSVGRSLFAIIESPELSFGSAVLFGQTIIKVVSGYAHMKPSGAEQPVFIIALIIVFGLVPSLVVLALLVSVNPIPQWVTVSPSMHLRLRDRLLPFWSEWTCPIASVWRPAIRPSY
jgi:hypothetical protein